MRPLLELARDLWLVLLSMPEFALLLFPFSTVPA
jgi:hypothetical protein